MLFVTPPPSAALGSPLFAYSDIDPNRTPLDSECFAQPPLEEPPITGLQETGGEQHERGRRGRGLGAEQDLGLLAAADGVGVLGRGSSPLGTALESASEHFKGVTAVALSNSDPVGLSKAIAKFAKANPDIFTFKAGIVEGKVVALNEVEAIASLPSKEELISKVMFLINCQAQRLVTVISAVPRNLAIVVKQIGEQKTA